MSIVLNPYGRAGEWSDELARLLPDDEISVWPDTGDPDDVEFAIAWRLPRAAVREFRNLRAILSLGAGAEQWQVEGMPIVPVVRLVDPAMSNEMAAYAVAWVVRLQRRFDDMAESQRQATWEEPDYVQAWRHRVGILGHGTIGGRIAKLFLDLDFHVNAWSRSGGTDDHITHFVGDAALDEFLASSDSVVNVLPDTIATRGLLDAGRFAAMADGSVLINIGRGATVVESDLVDALDRDRPRAAVLDVFEEEPLPASSPLWSHPKVFVTPHVAGSTQVRSAAEVVVANIDRIRNGEQPYPLLDRGRGY